MQKTTSDILFSPSDLTVFLESPFASWMDHFAVEEPDIKAQKDKEDPLLSLLAEKGNQHENSYVTLLKEQGKQVVDISLAKDTKQATIEAMKQGVEVIFQGSLSLTPFRGHADFLVKVPGESQLGDYHYEVWDTKLSRSMKPYFVIQLCAYAQMLEPIQGILPKQVVVVLGNNEQHRIAVNDFYYYFKQVKSAFLDFHQEFDRNKQPDPNDSASYGQWSEVATAKLLERDDLSQIATITKRQIKLLNAYGIKTLTQFVGSSIPTIKGIQPEVLSRLHNQARVQLKGKGKATPIFEIKQHAVNEAVGLALLPPSSSYDVFFDIEGYPLEEGGLEYLWGNTYFESGKQSFKDFWAHNQAQEKQAFSDFITWVYQRWQQHKWMHVYHYASYEITAIKKLMQRYGCCEFEVDELLRNQVFIDLYKVVKGAIVISEPRYSIKNVEHLYRGKRETEVGTGTDSVVVYENWRNNPDGDTWQTSKVLNDIREYNIDDCDSTYELAEWLREHQKKQGIAYVIPEDSANSTSKASEKQQEQIDIREDLQKTAKGYDNPQHRECIELLSWLVEFHQREKKPEFWLQFERLDADDEALYEDPNTLAKCCLEADPPFSDEESNSNKLIYTFSFDPEQDFKGDKKNYILRGFFNEKGKALIGELIDKYSDFSQGVLALKLYSVDYLPGTCVSLIPNEYISTEGIEKSIAVNAYKAAKNPAKRNCLLDFLCKRTPNITGLKPGKAIIPANSDPLKATVDAVNQLESSYLIIQGPPGAGKTFTGKHVIVDLLAQGKKIGICSNSHKAIQNLLVAAYELAVDRGVVAKFFVSKKLQKNDPNSQAIDELKNTKISSINNMNIPLVFGTTVWGFGRADAAKLFDYLFIDEAGQVSLANYVAMSHSASNIILLGDQMQLGQPTKATHPEKSGLSVLDYSLQDYATVPEDMGIFLNRTYRMHPKVNQFISDAIYESKLTTDKENSHQQVILTKHSDLIPRSSGICYYPVQHAGNAQGSEEEVEVIQRLTSELLGARFIDKKGETREVTYEDILYVAPFNFQVSKLKNALGPQARVGSVDKFQGQEAPVVILSMCASSAEDAPRGLDFLFNRNRLNVAISRAQSLALIVASDKLVHANANSIANMQRINTYCHLVDYAETKNIDLR